MIKERHMVTAKRLDNGDSLYGGYYEWGNKSYIVQKDIWDKNHFLANLIEVDPATIEPVAVRPIIADRATNCYRVICPNCETTWIIGNSVETPSEYCKRCGMRFDWSDNDE